MNQARAILWAQWRSMRNLFPRRGIGLTAFVGLIWYGFWAAVAFAVMLLTSSPISGSLAGIFLLVFLYWQVVPILMAASGASLELRKLQAYPIPVSQLFGLEVMLRVTVAIEVILVLTGAGIGILRNPTLHPWNALGLVPFAVFNLVLGLGSRDAIGRILARRRIREAAFFLLILCAALPQVLLTRGRGFQDRIRAWMARGSWPGWPWTATGNFVQGHDALLSLAVIVAWVAAAGLFSYWQFQRTISFDVQAAAARPSNGLRTSGLMERLFRLPSMLLSDPLGALVEKEVRFLTRSPRFRLVFLMGFTFGLLVWLPVALGRQGGSPTFLSTNYLTVVSVYSLLLLSEACFWNFFGFDRSAAQIYFLAPVPFSRVMIAKNLSAVFFIVLEIALIALVCGLLGMPLRPRTLAESFGVASVISIFMLAAGNQLSVRQPRAMNPAASFRSGASGRVQAILFVIYPVAFVPVGLAYLARYAFASEAAFFGVLALDAAIGAVVYKLSLDSSVAAAEQLNRWSPHFRAAMVRLQPELYCERMEPEVQEQFDAIRVILREMALSGERTEARFNRRMDRVEKRLDRAEQRMDRADKRMDRAEQRGDLADRRIEATRKLVEAGMKIVVRNSAEIKALGKRMDAFLRSTGNGHNGGNGHGPKRSR